jgi:hypothetical protein
MKRVCELNARAIFALAQGQPAKHSILSFKEAMEALDLLCTASPEQDFEDSLLAFRSVQVPGLNDSNDFYIIDQAILVSSAMITEGTTELKATNMTLLCSILTFNMALTYHQLGHRSGNSRRMKTAYRLYGNCIEMARCVEGVPLPRVGDARYVLHMMAMNNAAQIQCNLANFEVSDQLMADVRLCMVQLVDNDKIPVPFSSEKDLLAMLPRDASTRST